MIISDAQRFATTNRVLVEARIAHDPYDQFAWVQEWRFAIAQYLTDQGEYVPEFRGSYTIREDYTYGSLLSLSPTVDELTYALTILNRFRVWLGLAGRDY
jgi:hypothetical protein